MAKKHLDDESTISNIDESMDESPISAPADSQKTKSRFDEIKSTDDFADFITVQIATGRIQRSDLADLSIPEQDKLADAYEIWVSKGRPRPIMAKEDSVEVPKIQKIYRIKDKGRQFLACVIEGQSGKLGVELDPIYGKTDGKNGEKVDDTSIITGHTKRHTIPYTDALAREMLAKAKRYNDQVQLYFKMNTINILVNHEENFTGDFDVLMKKALNREEI
jgi:hypothetical protein